MTNANLIGFKVFANYGAMFPVIEGTITAIDEKGYASFEGHDGETYGVEVNNIRTSRPTSGSPIGVYFREQDAY